MGSASETGPDDGELVRRAQEGDDAAFRLLFDRYSTALLARIEGRLMPGLHRKLGASDVLQEAYLVALGRMGSFEDRGAGSFGRWLGGIVELKVREAMRRYAGAGKRAVGREVARAEVEDPAGRDPTPSAAAMANEAEHRARAAIAELPDDHREVLRLLQEQQLSLDETARRMGRTRQAVQKLYERALAMLAARMGLAPEEGRR